MCAFSPSTHLSTSGSLAPPVPRVRFVSPPAGEADTESVTDVDSEEEVTAMEASSKGLGMGKLPRN